MLRMKEYPTQQQQSFRGQYNITKASFLRMFSSSQLWLWASLESYNCDCRQGGERTVARFPLSQSRMLGASRWGNHYVLVVVFPQQTSDGKPCVPQMFLVHIKIQEAILRTSMNEFQLKFSES
ncbi:unnamed protein product [Prorocentrum cordatum]|uniref:Uncharacterized protein n=1 Tax=Prorocentrum cordatum TaxID=2364126 RepID=A0ABN9XI14_9DINO|nr:unnamed protein product [Polarella glacialis]